MVWGAAECRRQRAARAGNGRAAAVRLLAGKRIVVTGVLNRDSIAYAVAERAQEEGAEVVLTGFGRARRLTERAARTLPAVRRPRARRQQDG